MSGPILATKLYIPPPRPKAVPRPCLVERLNEGLAAGRTPGVTLISAPAGFGKTTLVSEWLAGCGRPAAWLSLDEGDNDPTRFLAYLVAALQTLALSADETSVVEGIAPRQSPAGTIGEGILAVLQSPQPPPTESILTVLLNEITTLPDNFVLVLDDYHTIDAKPVDLALTYLIEHLPPQMHLVIATREDPHLPLARLRVQGQLTELRAADLRFSPAEAAEFLNQVMGLDLSAEDIAALETRTEGWIAGLQMAALALQGTISMPGHQDANSFIKSFTGSHHFVLDYLIEEVLRQQSESVQTFLLRTSILDRLCGPLCDAVCSAGTAGLGRDAGLHPTPTASGQETLEYLEHANLFLVPLDNERRWYRYHHLFAGFLRQRLQQQLRQPVLPAGGRQASPGSAASSTGDEGGSVAELHIRASQWYEDNGLELEAFHHAAAANDVERAERLIEGTGMPLHFRGASTAILDWLASLPTTVLNARPSLWIKRATLSLASGQTIGVEEKLQAAEAALAALAANAALAAVPGAEPVPPSPRRGSAVEGPDDKTRNLVGIIAAARATLALTRYDVETMIAQSRRALEYLHPANLSFRFTAIWTQAFAYLLQGDRVAAGRACTEALSISQASGDIFSIILALMSLGQSQELENQLYPAAETYRRILQLIGDYPQPNAGEVYLGLARICYEWNDLDAAEQHGQQSVQLTRQYESIIDRFIICEVFLARLKLAQGDVAGAAAILAKADQSVRQHNFVHRMPEVAAAQVLVLLRQDPLLRQGNLAAAAELAQTHELPASLARVRLAQGDPSAALALLSSLRQQMEAKGWADERLKVMVLQAVALRALGEKEEALQLLGDALALAEPGGFIRLFVDEGAPMARLLSEAAACGIMPDYTARLLAAFEAEERPVLPAGGRQASPGKNADKSHLPAAQPLIEPLSERELEILELLAQGLSNREISERLFLALNTVKGHNRKIFGKLQAQRRTEAVARARELGLL